jgi:hypothetical protein
MSTVVAPKTPDSKVIEDQCIQSMKFYQKSGFTWAVVHYVFGIIAVIVAGLPAGREIWANNATMESLGKFGAFASPIMVAIIAFLNSRQYSDSWFLSWRVLKKAWGQYHNGDITAAQLWEAWDGAERIEVKDTTKTS